MFFSGNVTLGFYAVDIFRMATSGVDQVLSIANFISSSEALFHQRLYFIRGPILSEAIFTKETYLKK